MLVNIRYILLKKDDDADCYTIIFHYPKEGNISNIMEISAFDISIIICHPPLLLWTSKMRNHNSVH